MNDKSGTDKIADDTQFVHQEAVAQAQALIRRCSCPHGFLAGPDSIDNYGRVWGRDGVITGLAVLMAEDQELIKTFRKTLFTLATHQGPHGEIPSNVGFNGGDKDKISYGGTAGRVDADLWFVIGCCEYWQKTRDDSFLEKMMPVIEKVMFLLGAWEFNNRGFIYVPATGDWSDEYVQNGYILYDQLLYLQAQKSYRHLLTHGLNREQAKLTDKINRLTRMIRTNFWFGENGHRNGTIYHQELYDKSRKAADRCAGRYWLPFFYPHGYGYRFDAFANVLASLFGISSPHQQEIVADYIEENILPGKMKLLPAFHPVITPDDKDWEELNVSFSFSFKNRPHEYHNGGLWQMITGFYIADLAERGDVSKAWKSLTDVHRANRMRMGGVSWSFPEYVNGRYFTPGGNRYQCWSASAAVMGYYALTGKKVVTV